MFCHPDGDYSRPDTVTKAQDCKEGGIFTGQSPQVAALAQLAIAERGRAATSCKQDATVEDPIFLLQAAKLPIGGRGQHSDGIHSAWNAPGRTRPPRFAHLYLG